MHTSTGIKDGLKPVDSVEEDVFDFDDAKLKSMGIEYLPHSLSEAVRCMKESELAKEVLGEHTYKHYLAAKSAEVDEFRLAVTDWELKKYIETV